MGGEKLSKIRKTPRSQALAPKRPGKGEEEHTHRHKVKAHVEEDRAGSRLTCAEKEGVKRSKERRNGGRVTKNKIFNNELGVRDTMCVVSINSEKMGGTTDRHHKSRTC